MKELKQAIILVTVIVLLGEAAFEFFYDNKAFFSGVLVTSIAGLFIYSVKSANKNAKQ